MATDYETLGCVSRLETFDSFEGGIVVSFPVGNERQHVAFSDQELSRIREVGLLAVESGEAYTMAYQFKAESRESGMDDVLVGIRKIPPNNCATPQTMEIAIVTKRISGGYTGSIDANFEPETGRWYLKSQREKLQGAEKQLF